MHKPLATIEVKKLQMQQLGLAKPVITAPMILQRRNALKAITVLPTLCTQKYAQQATTLTTWLNLHARSAQLVSTVVTMNLLTG